MPTTRACLATTTTATRSTRPGQHSTIAEGITSVIISLFHICMVQRLHSPECLFCVPGLCKLVRQDVVQTRIQIGWQNASGRSDKGCCCEQGC